MQSTEILKKSFYKSVFRMFPNLFTVSKLKSIFNLSELHIRRLHALSSQYPVSWCNLSDTSALCKWVAASLWWQNEESRDFSPALTKRHWKKFGWDWPAKCYMAPWPCRTIAMKMVPCPICLVPSTDRRVVRYCISTALRIYMVARSKMSEVYVCACKFNLELNWGRS